MKTKYKSDAFEAIHTTIEAMYRIGTVDKATMERFDESCLVAPKRIGPTTRTRVRKPVQRRG
jgi:putative transcriptional regulator